MEIKKCNSNEGVFNSIVGLNVSTAHGNMTIGSCKYVFLTENRGKPILNLQYELDISDRCCMKCENYQYLNNCYGECRNSKRLDEPRFQFDFVSYYTVVGQFDVCKKFKERKINE